MIEGGLVMRRFFKSALFTVLPLWFALASPASSRNVLLEMCVSAQCGVCPALYLIVEDLKQLYPQLICLRYFTTEGAGPFANSEATARHDYYLVVQTYPTSFLNGTHKLYGAQGVGWWEHPMEEELAKHTPFELLVTMENAGNAVLVRTTVRLTGNYYGTTPKLRVALAEDDVAEIMGAPYTDIARRVVDVADVTIIATGQEQNFVNSFNVSSSWERHKLRGVSFLQIDDTREILQVADGKLPPAPPPVPYGRFSGHVTAMIPVGDNGQYIRVVLAPILDIYLTLPWWWVEDPFRPLSLGLLAGYNPMRAEDDAPSMDDDYIVNLNLNLKYNFRSGARVSPFVGAGPGYYLSRADIEFGVDAIAGVDIPVASKTNLELGAYYHYLFDDGNTQFVQVGAGVLRDF
jgi:opacity protein-like surface antigen